MSVTGGRVQGQCGVAGFGLEILLCLVQFGLVWFEVLFLFGSVRSGLGMFG